MKINHDSKLNVLFVSSGNSKTGISIIVKNQGESIAAKGINVEYFTIKGKGFKNYVLSGIKLAKYLNTVKIDVVHAHYSFSAFIAGLFCTKPIIASLMGSDVYQNGLLSIFIRIFYFLRWKKVIVKSNRMLERINLKNAIVLPNGVDLNLFKPIKKEIAIEFTHWNINKKHILFAANPLRKEKNYTLAENAFNFLDKQQYEMHTLENIPHEIMPYYYNSADVILLTSIYEGSPNVVKEALACNTPVVSTDIGDVKEQISSIRGCYVCENVATDIQKKLILAINEFNDDNFYGQNIISSEIIADRIIDIYKSALKHRKVF